MKNALQARINDLIKERDRKTQLSLQAIAARTDIKNYLDVERNKVKKLEDERKQMQIILQEAEAERSEAIEKHDEMFQSVSNLNSRIEELESHKLQLLNKLKGYGDKGGLEYIVKTMGIENIQAKDFEGRVKVEEYDPEARRAEADKKYAEERRRKKEVSMRNNPSTKSVKSTRSSK